MRVATLAFLILIAIASTLYAAVPQTISYQGYLTTSAGAPAAGPVNMVFSLYSSNPARNNPVWREAQPSVPVTNGIFSVRLGSVTPIAVPFNVPYWLGITVGADPEMTPLQPLASVGYALRAATVEIVPCIPGDFVNCYTGPAGTMNVGVCKPGLRTCTPVGTFGDCVGEVVPSPEVCGDGFDNNCNGVIDEGCPTCTDMTKNGNETDVDCGGGTCPPCATGKQCLQNSDCASVTNGTPVCTNGACGIAACTTGYANCNNNPADGCEINLNTDVNNCGACGHACASVTNGTPGCTNGACGIASCNTGYADCDHDPTDGCETNLNADTNNCGACGNVCPWPYGCHAGTCGF